MQPTDPSVDVARPRPTEWMSLGQGRKSGCGSAKAKEWMQLGQGRLERRARGRAGFGALVEDAGARRARRGLELGLVAVLRDLHKRHEARQPVLLGALPLDVEALAGAHPPQHLGDRIA